MKNNCLQFIMEVDSTQVKKELGEIESQLDRIIEKYEKVKKLSDTGIEVNVKGNEMNSVLDKIKRAMIKAK